MFDSKGTTTGPFQMIVNIHVQVVFGTIGMYNWFKFSISDLLSSFIIRCPINITILDLQGNTQFRNNLRQSSSML